MAVSYRPPPIGSFKNRMAISAIATDDTADGGTDETPAVVAYAWCSIESPSGQQVWIAKEQQDKITHVIRMAYQPGISPKMRGSYNGRTFNFLSVIDKDERHVELVIMATEVIAQ